jgi:glycosyltransferase involved in cell wall biosynthesis
MGKSELELSATLSWENEVSAKATESGDRDALLVFAVPTYKRGDYLVKALKSIIVTLNRLPEELRAQTAVVVVNDGSEADQDLTQACETLFSGNGDGNQLRLSLWQNSAQLKQHGNSNQCVLAAKEHYNAKWVTILHSDDIVFPVFAQTVLKNIKRHPKAASFSAMGIEWHQNADSYWKSPLNQFLTRYAIRKFGTVRFGKLEQGGIPQPCFTVRTDAFFESGGYSDQFGIWGEGEFSWRFNKLFRGRTYSILKPLYVWRIGTGHLVRPLTEQENRDNELNSRKLNLELEQYRTPLTKFVQGHNLLRVVRTWLIPPFHSKKEVVTNSPKGRKRMASYGLTEY